MKFPLTLITNSGYEAIVTNPEKQIYHFEVIKPEGVEPFTLRDNLPPDDSHLISGIEYERAKITPVHSELFQHLRFEQEKHDETA